MPIPHRSSRLKVRHGHLPLDLTRGEALRKDDTVVIWLVQALVAEQRTLWRLADRAMDFGYFDAVSHETARQLQKKLIRETRHTYRSPGSPGQPVTTMSTHAT